MQEFPNSNVDRNAVSLTTGSLQSAFEKRPMFYDLERISSERPDDFGFLTVSEAQEAVKKFHSDDDLRGQVVSLCDALARMHLDDFFARCAPSSTEKEKSLVSGLVLVNMESGRFDRVSSLISDIAQYGTTEALKKSTKVESGGAFGHIFYGVHAAIEIFVILIVIGFVEAGFQTLVMSSLALIYASLGFAIAYSGRSNALSAFDQSASLLRIRFLLKDRMADTDVMLEGQDNLVKSIGKADIRHKIFIARSAIIELIGIVEILKTVFRG
jgi:hypothetical protein